MTRRSRAARIARYAVAACGGLVFAGALAVLVVPPLADVLPLEAAVDAAGSDYQLIAVFGGLALLALLTVLAARALGRVEQGRPPDPEFVERVPAPGAEFDALVEDGLGRRAALFSDAPDRVRARLRETAARTLARTDNCSREIALDRVDSGAWTDDAAAAAFLSGRGPPVGVRVRAALRGRSWPQHGAAAAAEAIAARSERGPGAETAPVSGGER
ncbi:hypothetical protein ACFQPA_21235 [Halomarina halobia]|uniref:Alkaline shock response membrane anchor protein AmaP n=1 Tax=Halomarina halobia TaxID=3033386 RepID=A0ABD6AFZ2_9EURY|nr:hypothetical protein [Halomarina sp. PSR21]